MQPGNQGNSWQPQSNAPVPLPVPPAPTQVQPPSEAQNSAPSEVVTWQASEYVHHEKDKIWFVILFGTAVALLCVALFVVQSITFAVLVVVMTATLAVFAVRPPRIMNYGLSAGGIQINDKHFLYHDFRYFGVVQDGPLYTAVLIPNKRFMPTVNIYFPAENGEEIVDVLGDYLPMEHVELDFLDQLVRRLRF